MARFTVLDSWVNYPLPELSLSLSSSTTAAAIMQVVARRQWDRIMMGE